MKELDLISLQKSKGDDTSNSLLATRLGSSKNLLISCSKFAVMRIKTRDTNSHFKMKLTQTVGEYLGIPEEEYHATVRMPQARLAKICKDLSSIGDAGILLFHIPKCLPIVKNNY